MALFDARFKGDARLLALLLAFNVATILFPGRKKPCGEIIKIDNGIRATAYWPGVSSNASSLDVIRNACETR